MAAIARDVRDLCFLKSDVGLVEETSAFPVSTASNAGEASDRALMVAVGQRQEEAFVEVYRRHAGAALVLAQRLVWTRHLAEDVVQEVFLRLWRQPERFDSGRGSLRSYILTMSHGRAVDAMRSETSRRVREERDAATTIHTSHDLAGAGLGVADGAEVHRALDGLAQGERDAIALAYLGGHTYREVASMLQEPEGTVKSRIRLGLRRLQGTLVSAGVEP